jgi:hypothetical protein
MFAERTSEHIASARCNNCSVSRLLLCRVSRGFRNYPVIRHLQASAAIGARIAPTRHEGSFFALPDLLAMCEISGTNTVPDNPPDRQRGSASA